MTHTFCRIFSLALVVTGCFVAFSENAQAYDECHWYDPESGYYIYICGEPPPPPPAAEAYLSASPTTINYGNSTVLYWSSANVGSCTGTGFNTGGATSGAVAVAPSSSATYVVNCGSAVAVAYVTVIPPPPSCVAQYNPNVWYTGGTYLGFVQEWTSGGIDCMSHAPSGTTHWNRETINTLFGTNPIPADPVLTRCYYYSGSTSSQGMPEYTDASGLHQFDSGTSCTAPPTPAPTAQCSVTPSSAAYAQTSTLSWDSTNATYCALWGVGYYGTSGSITYTASASYNYSINCYGPGGWSNTYSCPQTVAAAQSDLTASIGAVINVAAGQLFTMSTSYSNIGMASTGIGFTNLFQLCNAGCTTLNTLVTSAAAALGQGASGTAAGSTSIATQGTYYYRLCADYNTSWVGSVAESNEDNNCGEWQTINVSAPVAQCANGIDDDGDGLIDLADPGCTNGSDTTESPNPPTASLSANPGSVVTGNSSTLSWSSSGATSCAGTGFSTSGATSGSVSTGPLTANSNYQLSCTGPGGTANDTETVTVTVPTADITATPDRVASGGSVSVTWTTEQCTAVVVSKNGAAFSTALSGTNVSSGPITGQTTFTATCDGGTATDSVIVNVIPKFEEF